MTGRTATERLDLDHISTEVGQNFTAQQASLIGETEDAIETEEIISVSSGHRMVSGVEKSDVSRCSCSRFWLAVQVEIAGELTSQPSVFGPRLRDTQPDSAEASTADLAR
jgi:hypothetical protein